MTESDKMDAGDEALRGIGRRERGAMGPPADGTAPFWQEASRAEVWRGERASPESEDAFADIAEK